ncbi:hypothetical protein FACS189491_00560 [Spirochaetia bacterium]|nr:hypothetical protein FACS189491_00560 [Spirochaetia bacterium]
MIGIILKNYNSQYSTAIKASRLSIIPVVAIAFIALPTLDRFSIYGVTITYLVLSFCLSLFIMMKKKRCFFVYLGKNSYAFVLFSPIFTVSCGMFLKYFVAFDVTGILYLIFASVFTVIGSLFVAYLVTKIKISYYILGVKQFYKYYKR